MRHYSNLDCFIARLSETFSKKVEICTHENAVRTNCTHSKAFLLELSVNNFVVIILTLLKFMWLMEKIIECLL